MAELQTDDGIFLMQHSRPELVKLQCTNDTYFAGEERKQLKIHVLFSALCISIFLAALDSVLISTALPTVSQKLGISDSAFAWIGSAYLLSNAATSPLWGSLSEAFGPKCTLLTANIIFLIGSTFAALSNSFSLLIFGRIFQGIGAGGISILVNVVVSEIFSARDRSFYLGIVGSVWAVASALGPVLGGLLSEKIGWRSCFWLSAFFDGLVLFLVTVFLSGKPQDLSSGCKLTPIDWLGSLAISAATVLLLFGIQVGGLYLAWNSFQVILLHLSGGICFCIFFWTQWKYSKHPILPFRIIHDASNLASFGICFADALVFNSAIVFLPLYFELVCLKSPLVSGLIMLALAGPLSLFSTCAGLFMRNTGHCISLLRWSLLIVALVLGLFATLSSISRTLKVVACLIILGVGLAPNYYAPLIVLQSNLSSDDLASGTAAFGFIRMVSGAIGVVVGQIIFALRIRVYGFQMLQDGLDEKLVVMLLNGNIISQADKISKLDVYTRLELQATFKKSLSYLWAFCGCISVAGLILSMWIKPPDLRK